MRILVTDAQNLAGLGAIRSLGRAGHTVIAAYPQDTERCVTHWSRYVSGELRYPSSRQHQFAFREWLRDQVARDVCDAILPISESSIVGTAAVRQELEHTPQLILPSDAVLEYTLSKFHSTRAALSAGIPCPPTHFISDGTLSPEKWDVDFSALRMPIVIRTDNYLAQNGVYIPGRTFPTATAEDARAILRHLGQTPTRIIAQEMIPGSGTGAFLLRYAGQTFLRFAHRRLHEVPYTGGPSSLRESCKDNELTRLGEILLAAIDYEGVAMVEFRRRADDGKLFFLEINGRLWGSLALALHAGVDFPRALIECYQNGYPTIQDPGYRCGIKCRNIFPGELNHLYSILTARSRQGIAAPPSKLGALAKFLVLSLNPLMKYDFFWWTDPLPGVAKATGMTLWMGKKTIQIAVQKFQTYRENLVLQRTRADHRKRCKRSMYFQPPLRRVMFLCYGNICRSPFAAHYWNRKWQEQQAAGPFAVSAGFHPYTDRQTPVRIADLVRDYGVDLTRHRSQLITQSQIESVDAIFVMDRRNYRDLLAQFPGAKHKTHFLGLFGEDGRIEIPDPYDMNLASARLIFQQLSSALQGLLQRVQGKTVRSSAVKAP